MEELLGLPPKREIDFTIELKRRIELISNISYHMSTHELKELHMQLKELLDLQFIGPSVSPWRALIIFVKNMVGSWRLCIDYQQLNKVMIKKQYHLPRIDNLFDQMKRVTIFLKIDLSSRYHQLRIKEEDIPKTTLKPKFVHYKFVALHLGLTNILGVFMILMNGVFCEYLD